MGKRTEQPVEKGLLLDIGHRLARKTEAREMCLVCDRGAFQQYGHQFQMGLEAAGFAVTTLILTPEEKTGDALVPRLTGAPLVVAFGGGKIWEATEGAMTQLEGGFYCVVPTTFAGGLRMPKPGARLPDAFFSDPDTYESASEASRMTGLVLATRLGLVFDKWIFGSLYSSFDKGEIVMRNTRIWCDLCLAEQNGSMARRLLGFGEGMARGILLAAPEFTPCEALALGMLMEAKIGRKAGAVRGKYLKDLEGLLFYRGLPTGIDGDTDAICDLIQSQMGDETSLTLYIPKKAGECIPTTFTFEELKTLARNM